jgi:hypothetical protein
MCTRPRRRAVGPARSECRIQTGSGPSATLAKALSVARSAPIARRKPRIMTARASSPTPSDVSMRGGGPRLAVDFDGGVARTRSNSDENWLGASGPLSRVSRRRAPRTIATKAFAGRARPIGRRQRRGTLTVSGKHGRCCRSARFSSRPRGRIHRSDPNNSPCSSSEKPKTRSTF